MNSYDTNAQVFQQMLSSKYPETQWAIPSYYQLMLSQSMHEDDGGPHWVPIRAQRNGYAVIVPTGIGVFESMPDDALVEGIARAVLWQLDRASEREH